MSAGDLSDREWRETPGDEVERIWWWGVTTGVVVVVVVWLVVVVTPAGVFADETLMSDIL